MFPFSSRRLSFDEIEIVGRHTSDYAEELQEAVRWLSRQANGGIPGGFKEQTPLTVLVGGTPDAGDESEGWMAANAQLVTTRGTPVAIGFANSAGTSTDGTAADHVHDGTAIIAAAVEQAGEQSMLLAWYL